MGTVYERAHALSCARSQMDNPANPRRKLLRGSLAAPVVLTVASPSALARTSFLACIERGANAPRPNPFTTSGDSMYRRSVPAYSFKLIGDASNKYSYFYNASTRMYYRLDICDLTGVSELQIAGQKTALGSRWGLVYFNNNGDEVGFGICPNGGYAVSASCWSSFKDFKAKG